MRFLLRWAFRLLLLVVVLVVGLVLLRGFIVKALLEQRFQALTGLEAHIGRIEVGLWSPSLTLGDVRIQDTAEFGGVRLADIVELYAVYDRAALRSRQVRFRLLRVNVRDLHIVESSQGRNNLGRFAGKIDGNSGSIGGVRGGLNWRFAGAEVLNLSLGKIQYTNLKRPEESQQTVAGLENEIINDVRTPEQLADAVLSRMLKKGITLRIRADSQGSAVGK